jgi:hypothetical protein
LIAGFCCNFAHFLGIKIFFCPFFLS